MRLLRVGPRGWEIPAVLDGNRAFDISSITGDIDSTFLESGGVGAVAAAMDEGSLPELEIDGTRVGAPIAMPGAVVCVGQNYAAHAAESGDTPPERPVMFLKTPNTVVGPDDQVAIPRGSSKTDWEAELGVVIGKKALYLESPEESLSHVAGFVTANDLSERAFQLEEPGGQWSKGKCAPSFTPLGPWLVTPDEIDHRSLRLATWVNGEPRQNSSTEDMIFNVEYLIWHLSQYLALDPGDLVLTGTPEGVALSGRFPYLGPGDVVEIEISGLGRQRQVFVSHEEAA